MRLRYERWEREAPRQGGRGARVEAVEHEAGIGMAGAGQVRGAAAGHQKAPTAEATGAKDKLAAPGYCARRARSLRRP